MPKSFLKFCLLRLVFVTGLSCHTLLVAATLPDSCRLEIGTNLSGVVDWSTEVPFVNLMKMARPWGTQNIAWVAGGNNPWDSDVAGIIPLSAEGYPTEIPFYQDGLGLDTSQCMYTVWADNESWPAGTYVFLYDGEGTFDFVFDANETSSAPGRIEVSVTPAVNYIIQLKILSTNPLNPARNFRFLMPGTEFTYEASPFNPVWLEKLQPFSTLRFMDWGRTNSWGVDNAWESYDEDDDSVRVPWTGRASPDWYTWATNKGVPYEMMIQACNTLHKNMWICVPHNAADDYIEQLAALVRDSLDPSLKVYVEYSNEIWNWGFGQAQWLYKFGCVYRQETWPEGTVSYIQNCLDIWSSVFSGQMNRIIRVAGVQAAWQDLSNRVVFNLTPGSFDAFSPAAYFGLTEEGDAALDVLGANATVGDLVPYIEDAQAQSIAWLHAQKNSIADSLHVPMIYYEGGQHITPYPFGIEPSYAQALLDIQRDPAIGTLYDSWFDSLQTLNDGETPALFMNFSLASQRSARYGSWGILEYINQDLSEIAAPKYESVLHNIFPGCADECPALCNAPAPLEATEVTSSSAKLNWEPEVCADKYKLRYRILGTLTWSRTSAAKDKTLKKLKNLLPASEYEWQIRSQCQEDPLLQSSWSASSFFTTLPLRSGITSHSEVILYPNPAHDEVLVAAKSGEQVELLDLTGIILIHETCNDYQVKLRLEGIPRGMYLIRVGNGISRLVVE